MAAWRAQRQRHQQHGQPGEGDRQESGGGDAGRVPRYAAEQRQDERGAVADGEHAGREPVDIVGVGEKSGGPTYAAITSRSYHSGGVNSLFGDGSVRFMKSSINGITWRALGSVGGGEVISSDSY